MLTIQPKFGNYSNHAIVFRAQEDKELDSKDRFYRMKVNHYKKQAQEFDELSKDEDSPSGFKMVMKGCGIVSEALLEGWAVAWGASKASKIFKSSFIKGAKTNFARRTRVILRPIKQGIKSSAQRLGKMFHNGIEKFKTSNFATKFNNIVEKMRNNAVGKYIVGGFELIGKGLKAVGNWISEKYQNLVKPIKEKSSSEIYDKVSKATSTTLGVGAGVAGAYNSSTEVQKRQANEEITDKTPNTTEEVDKTPEDIEDIEGENE